jgi:hypothetical protein
MDGWETSQAPSVFFRKTHSLALASFAQLLLPFPREKWWGGRNGSPEGNNCQETSLETFNLT